MKKIFAASILISSFILTNISAQALQTKSEDYIIEQEHVTLIQVKDTIKDKSITEFESITPLGNYLKIKKDGKYGVMDKSGNVILAPVFQRVNLVNNDNKEYFSAKADGKYRLYHNTGKLIPGNELYPVVQNSSYILARDLNPQFKIAVSNNQITYSKTENQIKDINVDNFVYEIEEIPITHVHKTAPAEIKEEQTNEENSNLFTINKKQFYIVSNNDKIGIINIKNKTIIPVKYDKFTLQKPCSHFKNPVFIVSKDNVFTIYNLNGRILAEQVYDKINVYRGGNVYSYTEEDNIGYLTKNGKNIGTFTKVNNEYKYTPSNFSLFKPHIVNNLILTILNIANL